jgi:hypothetical protein
MNITKMFKTEGIKTTSCSQRKTSISMELPSQEKRKKSRAK